MPVACRVLFDVFGRNGTTRQYLAPDFRLVVESAEIYFKVSKPYIEREELGDRSARSSLLPVPCLC